MSDDYGELYDAAGEANKLDPDLLRAMGHVESGNDRFAVSPAGAEGVMQIMPDTQREVDVKNPFVPEQSIHGGGRYLRRMVDQSDNIYTAIGKYNAGPNGDLSNPETVDYVRKVADKWDEYRVARMNKPRGAAADDWVTPPADDWVTPGGKAQPRAADTAYGDLPTAQQDQAAPAPESAPGQSAVGADWNALRRGVVTGTAGAISGAGEVYRRVTGGDPNTPNAAITAGQALKQRAERSYPIDPSNAGLATEVAGGLGSMIPMVGASAAAGAAAPVAGALAGAAVIGAQVYSDTREAALAKGAPPAMADRAATESSLANMGLLALPVGRVLHAMPHLMPGLLQTLEGMAKRGVEFAGFNSVATVADNYVAQHTYDPSRGLMDGVEQSALVGAATGPIFHLPQAARTAHEALTRSPAPPGLAANVAAQQQAAAGAQAPPGAPPPPAAPLPVPPAPPVAPPPVAPPAPHAPPDPHQVLSNIAQGIDPATPAPAPPAPAPAPVPEPTPPVAPAPAPAAPKPEPPPAPSPESTPPPRPIRRSMAQIQREDGVGAIEAARTQNRELDALAAWNKEYGQGAQTAGVPPAAPEPAPVPPTEHPGLVIKSLETGKETHVQPPGTVPPAAPEPAPAAPKLPPMTAQSRQRFEASNAARVAAGQPPETFPEYFERITGSKYDNAPSPESTPPPADVAPPVLENPPDTQAPETQPTQPPGPTAPADSEKTPLLSQTDSVQAPAERPAGYGAANTVFTADAAQRARERLRAKLGSTLNSGFDPELMLDGLTLAGYHVEAGARSFIAYSKAMLDDLGEAVRPYLAQFYTAVRMHPGFDVTGMDDHAAVEAAHRAAQEAGNGDQGPVPETAGEERPEGLHANEESGDVGPAPPGDQPSGPRDAEGDTGPGAEGRPGQPDDASGEGGRGTGSGSDPGIPHPGEPKDAGAAGGPPEQRPDAKVAGKNFVIEPGAVEEERGRAQKARDNVEAIRLAKQIIAEDRSATKAEQAALAKYVGWGGLSGAFPDSNGKLGKGLEKIGAELRTLLSEAEHKTASQSTQYAHYTAEHVIRSMWDAAQQMGFKGGAVFEPGMGVGHFLGMAPPDLAAKMRYQGVEMDHLTASIAKLLYPESGVRQADFTKMALPEKAFDLVIGNPPFSDTVIRSDPKYRPRGFMLHDYFFAKSLDAVRPGGLLGFVTSAGTMNKLDPKARAYLAERAEFVGGVRLPSDAFKQNAGTEVTTDVLFFKRRLDEKVKLDQAPDWTQTVQRQLPNAAGETQAGNVNRYFSEHPEQVLGHEGFFDKLYKDRYAVHNFEGGDLPANLKAAIERLPRDVMQDPPTPEQLAALDFASGQTKDGSYYLGPDGRLMQYSQGAGRVVGKRGSEGGGLTQAEQERVRHLVPIRDALRDVFRHDLLEDEEGSAKARALLNQHYDAFVAKFGPINKAEFQYRRPTIIQQEYARMEAREEARAAGLPFSEGSFEISPLLAKATPAGLAKERQKLREQYQGAGRPFDEGAFDPADMEDQVIEKRPNIAPFGGDPESYRLRSIERYDDSTGAASKKEIFERNILTKYVEPEIRSANDGVLWSMNSLGKFDADAIAAKMGRDKASVIAELGDAAFKVPSTMDTYQTRDEYLSGDVLTKLEEAQAAAATDPEMRRNVEALQAALPPPLAPGEISMSLGMPWIPTEVVQQFVREHLELGHLPIRHAPGIGAWLVDTKNLSRGQRPGVDRWGIPERDAFDLLRDALNRTSPRITRRVRNPDGSTSDVFDPVATQAAQDKVDQMKQAFRDYLAADPTRADGLAKLYNDKLNRSVLRQYDGSYLTTPGVAANWSWRPHQTRVVARIVQDGNTYMAHAVGAGKTSAMIGAGMEMRRLGLVKKPMYVVPNHMLGQFTKEFYEQYPTARIAVADEDRFHKDVRRQFMANIAQDDLDAVIITHSSFGFVPISEGFQEHLVNEQIEMLQESLGELDEKKDRITVKKLENAIEKLQQKLAARGANKVDQTLTFEESGVDFLFVDEAHEFRKLAFATKQGQMKGIDSEGSNKAWDLYTKARYLDQQRPGRSMVMASGTPVTNTMGELYSLSRFIQPDALLSRGLSHFDSWGQTFGEPRTQLEETAAGSYQPVTRFAQFVNLPELYKMVGAQMDIVTSKQLEQYVTRPQLAGGERQFHLAPRSPLLDAYQAGLGQRMEAIKQRRGPPQKGDDILLSVINDGRHAAIDPRFVADTPSDRNSKLNMMLSNVAQIYHESTDQQFFDPKDGYKTPLGRGPAAQMIFANLGVNPRGPIGFSGYNWMKQELIRQGVKPSEIAYIGDYAGTLQRQRLFNDVNEGKIRVLIGSTQKMGTGVNAQRRLIALHNQDPLWYPADDEQRVGRLLRQGNTNPEVQVHDYSTKGTYDSAMWKMMGNKARFIEQFFRGDPNLRTMEDLGEASMYEQASAMSTTDERIITLTQMKQDLEQARRREQAFDSEQYNYRVEMERAHGSAGYYSEAADRMERHIAQRQDVTGDKFQMTVGSQVYPKRADAAQALETMAHNTLDRLGRGHVAEIGAFGGFPLELRRGAYDDMQLYIKLPDGNHLDLGGKDFAGIVLSAEARLRGMEASVASSRETAQRALARAQDLRQYIGKEFPGRRDVVRLARAVSEFEARLKDDPTGVVHRGEMSATDPEDDVNRGDDSQYARRKPAAARAEAPAEEPPDEVKEARATLASAATDMMRYMGLPESVGLKLVDKIATASADASYKKNLITFALDTSAAHAPYKIWHEGMHALLDPDLGLLSPKERLALYAGADRWLKASPKRAADLQAIGYKGAELRDEAVARMAEAALASGLHPRSLIGGIVEKLQNVGRALGQVLRGQGWTTAEDVLNGLMQGKRASPQARAALASPGGPRRPAAPADEDALARRRDEAFPPEGEQKSVADVLGEQGAERFSRREREQEIPSAGTSQRIVPATVKAVAWKPGTRNLDIGGGRFDDTTKALAERGVRNLVYDPYNRPAAHNEAVLREAAAHRPDTVTVNNVLNVIREPQARRQVIDQAADSIAPGGAAHFLIYEGNRSGTGKVTRTVNGKPESWQNNLPAANYLDEIRERFSQVGRRGNLITASAPRSADERFSRRRPEGAMETAKLAVDDIERLFSPTTRSTGARDQELLIRGRTALKAQSAARTTHALERFRHVVGRLSETEQAEITDRMERGQAQRSPQLQAVADALRGQLDLWTRKIQSLGTGKLEDANEFYMGRIYKNYDEVFGAGAGANNQGMGQAIGAGLAKKPLLGSGNFLKRRVFEYQSDAVAQGLEPVTWNPIEMQTLKLREMQQYYHGAKMAEEMKATGLARWVTTEGYRLAEQLGMKPLDDRIFAPKIPLQAPGHGMLEHGKWYGPGMAADVFNNFISEGIAGNFVPYDMMRKSNNALNQLQLGLSGFHATFIALDTMTSRVALGLQQVARGDIGRGIVNAALGFSPHNVARSIARGSKLRAAYLDPQGATPEYQKLAALLNQGGGRINMDQFYRSSDAGSFFKNMHDLANPDGAFREAWQMAKNTPLTAPLRIAGRVLETITEPLMGQMVPRAKLGVFADLAADWQRRNPNASPAEQAKAMTKAWDSVDNRMGQLVYDNLFWNKTLKDTAFLMTRSVGWNLGTMRELGGGGVDTVRAAANLARLRGPEFTTRMAYGMAMPVVTALYGALLTYAYTGKGPQEMLDYFYPPDGKGGRNGVPGYIKDVVAYAHAPVQTLLNKQSPLLSTASQLYQNRDYYGGIINDPARDNPAEAYINYLLNQAIPFSVRAMLKNSAAATPPGAMEQMLAFWGVQPAPASIVNPERGARFQAKADKSAFRRRQKEEGRLDLFGQ